MKKLFILLIAVYSFATNILVLNSYSADLEWTEQQSDEIVDSLKNIPIKDKNIYVEFMDTKRFPPTKERDKNYLDYLIKKYKNMSFDIVVVTDDNALNFIRKHKNLYLFKKAKVFFQGINNLSLYDKLNKNIYAGVFEKKEPLLQLKLAKQIKPNLKTIYVLSCQSIVGDKTMKQYKKAFKNIKGINFVYIHSSNLYEILEKLKNYDKNSILMALTISAVKRRNEVLPVFLVEKLISKVYKNPILIHSGVWVKSKDSNIVGGVCTDARTQSSIDMKKLLKYINGIPMKDIGFRLNNVSKLFINVKNIRKFGIDEKKIKIDHLPIEYVNKPNSIYELYKWQIWTTFIIFVLIVAFLIILSKKNRELNIYSKKIEEINKDLEKRVKEAVKENTKNLEILQHQSKLAAMGEMVGMIAHQWRQPLNALALNIQFLPEMIDEECDEKALKTIEEFSTKSMDTINFMSQTINDFRNFFKKDKEKSEFFVNEEINKVLDIQEAQLKAHNIEVISDLKPIKIVGFKNEFKQVILNLISNAKDAIIKNNNKNSFIKISDYELNDEIFVVIEDNGGGIDKSIIDKIFEPYFTTKDTQGTGLGLYMSNEIIKRMNGKIEVKNIENGVRFTIRLKK